MKFLKKWQIRFLKNLCRRYESELHYQEKELDFSSYLMTFEERRDVQIAKENAALKVRALNQVINDLYVELDGQEDFY